MFWKKLQLVNRAWIEYDGGHGYEMQIQHDMDIMMWQLLKVGYDMMRIEQRITIYSVHICKEKLSQGIVVCENNVV